MKKLIKNPLLYTNVLLLGLVVALAPHAVPSYARAYSFVKNALAAVDAISGEGTVNFISAFAGATPSNQIGNSVIYEDTGGRIGIGGGETTFDSQLEIYSASDRILELVRSGAATTVFRQGIDGALVINNDNNDSLTVKSNNVGIGTTEPSSKLGVLGNLAVGATYGSLGAPTSGMIIEGDVGIGTPQPAYRLDVDGGFRAGNPILRSKGIEGIMLDQQTNRVGIGTESPVGAFDVNGSLASTNWTNVTFGSGWANYGGAHQTVQYKKFGDLVFLRGLATSASNWTNSPLIFTLPLGHRPTKTLIFAQEGNSSVAVRVDITSAGEVKWISGGAGSGWISLSGIIFSVD